jgi:hypothetical protein
MRAVHAMAMDHENWLAMEQVMEQENHVLLQVEDTPPDQNQPPQLLLISSHAAQGSSFAATFSLIVFIGGKRGLALVDSGSTDTFLDYTFASKLNCPIQTTEPRQIKVAGGGYLNSSAVISSTAYVIQDEVFHSDFKLLKLKGDDVIFSCDWIK